MMEGDPIIARLQSRKETFEFAGETLREQAAFFLVVNPDELSIRETRRAIDGLAEHGLEVRGLAVNRLTPEPDDDEDGRGARYLRQRVETETERLRELREDFEEPLVAAVETRVSEVKGSLLEEVAAELDIETR
jgi:arsenite-transporting ATPase